MIIFKSSSLHICSPEDCTPDHWNEGGNFVGDTDDSQIIYVKGSCHETLGTLPGLRGWVNSH